MSNELFSPGIYIPDVLAGGFAWAEELNAHRQISDDPLRVVIGRFTMGYMEGAFPTAVATLRPEGVAVMQALACAASLGVGLNGHQLAKAADLVSESDSDQVRQRLAAVMRPIWHIESIAKREILARSQSANKTTRYSMHSWVEFVDAYGKTDAAANPMLPGWQEMALDFVLRGVPLSDVGSTLETDSNEFIVGGGNDWRIRHA